MTTQKPACFNIQNELTAWSLGGLTPTAHLEIDTHLQTCGSCLADALSIRRVMCSDGSAEALPELEATVLKDFRTITRHRGVAPRPLLTGIAVALAASMLIAAAAMFLFADRWRSVGSQEDSAPVSIEYDQIFSDQTTIL